LGRLYLVRHGRTEWNKSEVFRGKIDVPLDDIGRKQAVLAKEALLGAGLRYIVTSPLKRAKETASIVSSGFPGVELIEDERATDIDVGRWGGMSLQEVSRKYPREYSVWVKTPDRMKFPDGESLEDVQARVWPLVSSFVPDMKDGDVLLVSHRLTLKVVILTAIGASLGSFWRIRLDTASLSILEHDGTNFVLTRMNDTGHLSPLGTRDRLDF